MEILTALFWRDGTSQLASGSDGGVDQRVLAALWDGDADGAVSESLLGELAIRSGSVKMPSRVRL